MNRVRQALALAVLAAAVYAAAPASASAALRFRACGEFERCARFTAPLDHSGEVAGRVPLRVWLERASERPRRGVTLVVHGPGIAAPGAGFDWSGQMPNHDVVTLGGRGSTPAALRCRDLEAATATDAGREAAACAALLGERRRFYRGVDMAEDLELLRIELGAERVTLVGLGHGSYVAQRYLLRHPERVERLILRGVVDADGIDPLYRDTAAAASRVLAAACRRRCGGFTRNPTADTARRVERLAAAPLRGFVVGPGGQRRSVTLTRHDLLFVLLAGDGDFISRSEYPAAVVSALRGDPAPLLRLKHRATRVARRLPIRYLSPAAATAATCEETRFPWSWQASPAERDEAAHRAASSMDPAVAAPFDPVTLARSDVMRLCRRWPTASAGPPPEAGRMPDVPVLMLAEPTTSRFPVETARRAAARYARAHVLVTPDAPWIDACTDRAVSRFMGDLAVADRCPRGPAILPASALDPPSLAELRPVRGVPGRRGRLLRAVAAGMGDLIDDYFTRIAFNPDFLLADSFALRGGGLRGGSYAIGEHRFVLRRYEYVPGVRVSGRFVGMDDADWSPMRVDGPGRLNAVLRVDETGEDGTLRMRGRVAGRRVRVAVRVPSVLFESFTEDAVEGGGAATVVADAGTALRWLRCGARPSPSSSSARGWLRLLRPARRCASSAAAATTSPARG